MKTHELAKNLSALVKALRSLPNVEVSGLEKLLGGNQHSSIALGLTTLTMLSEIDKTEWRLFVEENDLPIEIRARDASRDIIGKIMNYLQNNADARDRIASAATSKKSSTSPELQRALNILLNP